MLAQFFKGRLVSPRATSLLNVKPEIWDTRCEPVPGMIFLLQLTVYCWTFFIFTMSVTDRVNPITF